MALRLLYDAPDIDANQPMDSNLISEALRIVGADLDLRGLKTFSINYDADLFVVDAGYQASPATMPVTLHYCRKDVEELKRKADQRGDDVSATRSFIYLAETLSAIGTYIQDKAGCLASISNNLSTAAASLIEVQYTVGGDRIIERLTDADVYALCIRVHKRRQRRQASNDLSALFDSPHYMR